MKAIVLAGGKGMRLRPMTSYIPKVLLPVHGKPILDYIIDCLSSSIYVDEVFVAVSDHFHAVASYLSQRQYPSGLKVEPVRVLSWETGGDLRIAIEQAEIQDTFLACNGDVYAPLEIDRLIEFYFNAVEKEGVSASVLLKSVPEGEVGRHGLVHVKGSLIDRFVEKPKTYEKGTSLVNAGYYVFGKRVLEDKDRLLPAAKTKLEETALAVLARQGRLSGVRLETPYWIDVGTLPAYIEAQNTIANNGAIQVTG